MWESIVKIGIGYLIFSLDGVFENDVVYGVEFVEIFVIGVDIFVKWFKVRIVR